MTTSHSTNYAHVIADERNRAEIIPASELAALRAELELARAVATDAREQFLRASAELDLLRARIAYLEMCQEQDLRLIDSLRQHHSASCPGCALCISFTPSPIAPRTDGETAPDGRLLRGAP